MKQSDEAMKHSGRWLLGIVFLAVALIAIYFILFNIHKQMSMQQSDSSVDYSYDQYTDQEDNEGDAFDNQQTTDTFRESSTDIAQLINSQNELISQSEKVNEDLAKSSDIVTIHKNQLKQYISLKIVSDDTMTTTIQRKKDETFLKFSPMVSTIPKITRLEESSVNLLTLTTTVALIAINTTKNISVTTTATATRKYKAYKLNAFVKTSSDTLIELAKILPESLNSTDVIRSDKSSNSKQIATDSILSLKGSANSKRPVIREFSSSNNSTTVDPLFTRNYVDKQFAMKTTKFNKNLQNSRIKTISTPNLTTILSQPQQENMIIVDGETEKEEGDYEYKGFLFISQTATTSISITTTVTTTISTNTAIPELTSMSQSHLHLHHYHQYENYDHESPIIVTALFDIGRGKWPRYTRTYEQYMNYLKHLLKLKNHLVIYTDSRGAEFVREKRNVHNTQIFEISMHALPLYRYREEMKSIIQREQKDWRFSPKTRYHPEANSADYNIIVNSKPYFLYNATQSVRFRTSGRMFVWIDAGYGHGRKGIIPDHCHWRPRLPRDRVTVIQLTPKHDKVSRYSITDLYRVDWVVLSGGFIAGDSHTINRFYRFYQKLFMELLDSGRIDDDQTILTLMLKHYTTLFNPISSNGDWYAVFRLFPCHDRQ